MRYTPAIPTYVFQGQRLILPYRVIIRSSGIHAAGCFAVDTIPRGTRVIEYTGDRIPQDTADDLYKDRPYTYLFGIGDGTTVIARAPMAA